MKKAISILSVIFLCVGTTVAQSLAVNTDGSSAAASALLDVKSTEKGILIPRMSKTERTAIASPATGLLVFQDAPDSMGFYFYGGSKWLWLTNADNTDTLVWKRSGNAGTVAATHFIGTTDNRPLRFRINNIWAGEIDSTKRSVSLGLNAGKNTAGSSRGNIAIGNAAMLNTNFGSNNISIGDSSLYSANSSFGSLTGSIAIGNKAQYSNLTGTSVTAIGDSALYKNVVGIRNTAIGYGSSVNTISGNYNTAAGYRSLYANTSGYENTAFGNMAAFSNDVSGWQTAIGDSALFSNTGNAHHNNTALGAHAGAYNPGSSGCIYIGFRSGYRSSGGISSIFMGSYAGDTNTGDYNIGLGHQTLRKNTADFNSAVGYGVLEENYGGARNTGMGSLTLHSDTTGNDNTAVGYSALYAHKRNDHNTAVGKDAMRTDTTGAQNVAMGYRSMYSFNGDRNTAVGTNSLDFAGSGTNNTALGYGADVGLTNLTFATAIGSNARCDTSNSIVLGEATNTNVSVGTTKPLSRMDVNGSLGSGIRTVTANTTATVTDHTVIIGTTASAVTVTLPTASTVTRREYRIVNQNAASKVTSSYLDFTGTAVTTVPGNNSIVVQSNGSTWVRVL